MSRAVQDLETLRACLGARMKPASIAMTLGRSLKWVEARIAEIEAEKADDHRTPPSGGSVCEADEGGSPQNASAGPPQAAEPPASPQRGEISSRLLTRPEYARHRGVTPSAVFQYISSGRLAPPAVVEVDGEVRIDANQADAMLGPVCAWRRRAGAEGGQSKAARAAGLEPAAPAEPPTAADAPRAPPAPRRSRRVGFARFSDVEELKPVTPRVAHWAWWFVASGWALEDVAELFDRCPEALGRAVHAYRPQAAAA